MSSKPDVASKTTRDQFGTRSQELAPLDALLLAHAANHAREISNGDVEREVDGGEDESEEDPPTR